jgi:chemotaxis protein methyltransferase WspC
LDPDHAEALGHLALLLKKEGNAAGAKRMNDRMARADGRRAR